MVRHTLLEVSRTYWEDLESAAKSRLRFQHVSTDEVYGSLPRDGLFTEETPYLPSSPNSASKASSDHLVRALHHTFGLPVLITNCSNNFGPYQFPEKLIPVIILNAVAGRPLPIYRTGDKLRDWLYVDDHATALHSVLTRGKVGDIYNIGGHFERTNLNVVRSICGLLDELCPNSPFRPHASLISFVTDRLGHDKRYAIDASKIQRELDWKPSETFESGLPITVEWYLNNRVWWERVLSGAYRQMMDESESGETEKRAV